MRTVKEIYNSLVTAKDADATLNALTPASDSFDGLLADVRNNPAAITVWRSMCAVWAVALWSFELILEQFKSDVIGLEETTRFGHPAWWSERVLEYQYGYNISVVAGKPVYTTIDEAARVVTFVAVQESGGEVLIKAAKGTTAAPAVLSTSELQGLNSYVKKWAAMGIPVRAMSLPADTLKVYFDIYVDAIFGLDNVKSAVESAVNTYLVTLDFRGDFYTERLIDAIQAVPGVVSVFNNSLQVNDNVNGYRAVVRKYSTRSGYIRVDDTDGLSTTLNYVIAS